MPNKVEWTHREVNPILQKLLGVSIYLVKADSTKIVTDWHSPHDTVNGAMTLSPSFKVE